MKYFYAIMEQDGDSAYGVTFPDLPGCFSAADTAEEILPNACEALELWFDDQDEVEPSRLDQIKAAAAEALGAGATIIAVPRIVNDHRVARVNLSLERGILDAIDKAAAERRLTRSAFVAQAARNEIQGAH
ncbi:type II toxin-antitoxin system HicB family antitoxin [Novosphingobium sp. ST904]|uniref:type II toxin-antitoxin system HicB family antitoxin n=1 Tax=Novosphingobium sp. ST904 TaxID=1684385 RepID=UPI0006C84F76|nr:type II toxin-antitoxin system HicB family antitoxin [Novosphingobium sp. ST904]KPH68455.1 CopG family transcriptional regulator [Novosphingobium sp. ST904]TCM39163.1 HicB-like antitoxin of HicAB toxin-antitoxin system [Novosphingobium sp. ST904]